MQSIKIGDAINAQDHCFAVDHKLLDAVLQGGLGNPGIALGLVITAPGDQPHPIAVTLDADAEAVLLDFVEPLWACRNLGCIGRQAELKRLKHRSYIAINSRFANDVSINPQHGNRQRERQNGER